ncbi:FAD-dependent oxidoreductase [Sinirhodobacter sp. WL0062]|uniref:FAD-dependent oxidoreductase n=1 Tax=Rhodobacter flavimaris TaxID=2907145 RepID=A0ABS8YQQ1_9RHOB|nr:FAD-dependent oxidoreductase [Sinirhodobacter sp. WL0062]MCE5972013.1 FAD-dependent oxidoreductase [Sinirhodobacter sp. WL0062]
MRFFEFQGSYGPPRERVAVIGSGIAGLGTAWLLAPHHDVTLFEAEGRPGGHSRTREALGVSVDTGFIVCNPRTYRLFMPLMQHLGVQLKPTDMSFSASFGGGRYEFGTRTLPALFAQWRRAVDPGHLGLLSDALRFFRGATDYANSDLTLGQMVDEMHLGRSFRDRFLLPISGAIWSTPTRGMLDFPAAPFVRFFDNHGLLSVASHPQWYTVEGGARSYVERLLSVTDARVNLSDPVRRVLREAGGISLHSASGVHRFDRVVFACHAPQALAMITDPTAAEREILGAFRTQPNRVVLHSDANFMPRRRAAWSSWNYVTRGEAIPHDRPVSLSYWMNLLQGLKTPKPLIVTLNPEREPAQVHDDCWLSHPQFDHAAITAQARLPEIQGHGGLWFAGAWTRYGFHEDGLLSALRVAQGMGLDWPLGPDPWVEQSAPAPQLLEAAE